MQNAERGMQNEERPARKTGRPISRTWWGASLILGASYAIGAVGSAAPLGYSIAKLNGRDGLWVVVLLPPACFLALIPYAFVNNNPILRSRWQAKLAAVANWYIGCVGLVVGWLAGLAFTGITLLPWGLTRLIAIGIAFYGGPRLAFWWILRHQPGRPDSDYDDEMPREGAADKREFELANLAATESFGRRLGALLFPNAVVALIGPLGAGKTHLARAIAEGVGISNPAAVTSPTFTLIHEYPARLPIFHFDAYRLNSAGEFLDLGATEYYQAGGVCLIEWADRVLPALPDERLTIQITPVDENRRQVEMTATGEQYRNLLSGYSSRSV